MRTNAFLQGAIVWIVMVGSSAGADNAPGAERSLHPDLFHLPDTVTTQAITVGRIGSATHRFYLELAGARSQAEDWVRDAGFSLLEERDGDGRNSYELISGTLASEWTPVRLHARLGLPQLSAGMRQRREVPAFGATFPWRSCAFDLEALQDRGLGWAVMGRMHWSDPGGRVQYGVAVPVKMNGPSVGVLLQVRLRWGN